MVSKTLPSRFLLSSMCARPYQEVDCGPRTVLREQIRHKPEFGPRAAASFSLIRCVLLWRDRPHWRMPSPRSPVDLNIKQNQDLRN